MIAGGEMTNMASKYQEALDWCVHEKWIDDDVLAILQELIDNYNELLGINSNIVDKLNKLRKRNLELEKALDKACRTLETNFIKHYDKDIYNARCYTHKNWKEYLLKESGEE